MGHQPYARAHHHGNLLRKGQSFLALVFFIGGIVSIVGLLIAFLANSFIDTDYGLAASFRAQVVAESGVQDALLQLDRNAAFSNSGYSVQVGSSTVTVSVTPSSTVGFVTIVSSATVSGHTKKLSVIAAKNASTSAINIVSSQDIQ